MNKEFEVKLVICYNSIQLFTKDFLQKQVMMNELLEQRFSDQLGIKPPFLLNNKYLQDTVNNLGKLVTYIKPLYKEKVTVIAEELRDLVIFKKH